MRVVKRAGETVEQARVKRIDLRADALREEYALRLGLPANSHPADVLEAALVMTNEDIPLSDLQGLMRDMGGLLRIALTPRP